MISDPCRNIFNQEICRFLGYPETPKNLWVVRAILIELGLMDIF